MCGCRRWAGKSCSDRDNSCASHALSAAVREAEKWQAAHERLRLILRAHAEAARKFRHLRKQHQQGERTGEHYQAEVVARELWGNGVAAVLWEAPPTRPRLMCAALEAFVNINGSLPKASDTWEVEGVKVWHGWAAAAKARTRNTCKAHPGEWGCFETAG